MIELPPEDYRALVDAIAARLQPPPAAPPAPGAPAFAAPVPRAGGVPDLAPMIEATVLSPEATAETIDALCEEAAWLGVGAVCVQPCWIARAAARLRNTPVMVATVIGFPLGADLAAVKRASAAECLKLGADELDMVMNIGAFKSGQDAQVREDMRGVAEVAHAAGGRVKVILETGYLSREEIVRACGLAVAAGVDFVKTSTGFGPSGAQPAEVALMRGAVGAAVGVKAAGGIRTRAQAEALVRAGANRLGTSAAAAILNG